LPDRKQTNSESQSSFREPGNQPESNRILICASHSLFDLGDISESFRAVKQRDGHSNSAAAYHELERGATLHTHDAVYWMPLKWSCEATKQACN